MTATLEGRALPETQPIANGSLHHLGPGILELIPDHPNEQARACIFSVGIHGNETAPIELLDTCLTKVMEERIALGAPVLMILGNLEAIHAGQRFITTNLNRLFRRDLTEAGKEPDRARELMTSVDDFRQRHGERSVLHYDLHTAIRDSRYPRFVVSPFADTPVEPAQWHWLTAADIQAVLHQHQHSWTFSHYTRHYHGGQAFTLELGRALPFGHNDLAPLAPMGDLLTALIEGREPRGADPSRMRFFRVEQEVMRHARDFRLCFADDTPNFTEFAPGTLLAEDAHAGETRVGDHSLGVVFPNADVEVGARAALLVKNEEPPEV
ncbi:succinylglutamate desuccinylase [Halomonas urumqiensis]|uniref:Succinylglutamate desuccinylase n=2 Tax=Halomonas urumqiensis TaxID=1684789 RepID=A0A2N7UME2_9GAMM|nr:succinylglutamate desuccinylase [Halomonas urumqiensis]PTB02235.1 succinylglutamate desuccinylase [Halomonas urumqiensis]GHE21699.1 succinylglutamate desuccinylase [Halomonas urumqiensis]